MPICDALLVIFLMGDSNDSNDSNDRENRKALISRIGRVLQISCHLGHLCHYLGDGGYSGLMSWMRLPNMRFKKLVRLCVICQLD